MRPLYPIAVLLTLAACPRSPGPRPTSAPMAMDRSADSVADLRVCSPERWCWENPMPQGNDLLAVWAKDALNVLAVGRSGTVLSFNGYAWRREVIGGAADLFGVAGAPFRGQELVAVVGSRGTLRVRLAAAAKAQPATPAEGSSATKLAPWRALVSGTDATLYAVDVDSSGRIVAVGQRGVAIACKLDAGCQRLPDAGGDDLRALTVVGGALWAVGARGTILRLAAGSSRFVRLAHGSPRALYSAVAHGDALYAAGDEGTLVRCVATGCEQQRPITPPGRVVALIEHDKALLALVDDNVSCQLVQAGKEGATPTRISRRLFSLASTGATSLVAVGEGGSALLLGKKGWAHAMPLGSTAGLRAVVGHAVDDVYAAGEGGTVIHFDGRSWQPLATGTTSRLSALCADGRGGTLAGGDKGLVLSCDASRCDKESLPAPLDVRALAGIDERVYAAARGGALYERHRGRWTRVELGAAAQGKELLALLGTPQGLYVSGTDGLLLHLRKGAWRPLQTGTRAAITTLWGGAEAVYAGAGRAVLRCTGDACTPLTVLDAGPIQQLWGEGAGDGLTLFATSARGELYRLQQSAWHRVRVGFDGRLVTVWGRDGHLWAVGDKGAVLHRLPRP